VYPALAVLEALANDVQPVLWVGSEGGMEADLVHRAGISFASIPAAGVHGVGWQSLPGNILLLVRGYLRSLRVLHDFKPDVLFFTGGYVAVPMALAGIRFPGLLFVPDIEPGLALKVLARIARRIAVSTEESQVYFGKSSKIFVTGYPVRSDLGNWTRTAALSRFDLDPDQTVLLVFGGSKGARSLNRAILSALPQILDLTQVIHISGNLDWSEIQQESTRLSPQLSKRYRPFAYLHEDMGAALTCADLVVSRSGASSLGELPLFGVPAILVPYPYAWRYQKVNADYLANHGAAVVLEDAALLETLVPALGELFSDPSKLASMREAMRTLARPEAAEKIAALISELGHTPHPTISADPESGKPVGGQVGGNS
jgi:UDP-N-acetylglucosamine--N-acetylmuramyl-(pentapeptide) pyrophosphoryl-undecaprenol N-acetylglucosamine transferase